MAYLNDFNTANLILPLFFLSLIYTVWLVIYRLWLSPVAGFPGSLCSIITFWYEFHHEWIKPGQYHRKIQEMHARYGKL